MLPLRSWSLDVATRNNVFRGFVLLGLIVGGFSTPRAIADDTTQPVLQSATSWREHGQLDLAPVDTHNFGSELGPAPVEQHHPRARFGPHHMDQVMCLRPDQNGSVFRDRVF